MKMVDINNMSRVEIERELEDTIEAFANWIIPSNSDI
jgi:hypothetical protein